MTGEPSQIATLLAECRARGIRLLPSSDGELTVDAPPDALTADLLGRLKSHKVELLTLLLRARDFEVDSAPHAEPSPAPLDGPVNEVCRCGSTTWRDVPIHDGQSTRRDCARCGRFIDFPIWYGIAAGQVDQ